MITKQGALRALALSALLARAGIAQAQTETSPQTLTHGQTNTHTSTQTNAQDNAQTNSQHNAQDNAQTNSQHNAQDNAQTNSQHNAPGNSYADAQDHGPVGPGGSVQAQPEIADASELADGGSVREASLFQATVVGQRIDPQLTGSSATAVTRAQLESLPGGDSQTIAHIVEMQPGVVADNTFGFATHVRAADGAVMYVIDGIPLFPPPLGTLGQTQDTLPTRLVQTLKVYTGGLPLDYGYAFGGLVDITTRRPGTDPTAEAQISYGSYNLTDAALNYTQAFGTLSVVASADILSTGRGFDTPDAIDILHDQREGGNGFLKLDYELDSSDRIYVLGTFSQDHFQIPIDPTMLPLSDAPPGAVRGNDVYGNPPPQFVPYDANPTDDERNFFTALSYVHTGPVGGQVSGYVRGGASNLDCDPSGSLGVTADPGSTCSSISRNSVHSGGIGSLSWRWLEGNTWKAGVSLDNQQSKVVATTFTRDDSSPVGGADPTQTLFGGDHVNTLSVGAFLEDEIKLAQLTLQPGLRFDAQETSFGSSNEPSLFLGGPSARLGASYAWSDALLFHAYAGHLWEAPVNFDAPVAAQVLIPSLAGQSLPVDLKAATTWNSEVGVTVRPVSKLTLGLTAWGRLTNNMLDRQNVGNSNLIASFNWTHGRAYGADLFGRGEIVGFLGGRFSLDGFGNFSYQQAEQKDINSELFLFSPAVLAASSVWTTMDHTQHFTANLGLDLHDEGRLNNLAARINYGSGFHSGISTNELVPEHTTVDLTASHVFQFAGRPELAFDVFNLFNDIYAYRLGTAFVGNSAFAPLQHFDLRLIVHFS